MRTGDTAARDRQRLVRRPPDLLITTPESLYLMLTSSAAETLVGVETVIVDEIHALAATKRGAHLAVSLERLEELTARPPQRIGLSATQRPLEEVARFLGGFSCAGPSRARSPSSTPASANRSRSRSSSPSRTWPTSPATAGRAARPRVHLAEHLPAHPRPGARAPLDDHLLQRPTAGRAPRRQAQRARRGARHRRRPGQGAPRLARPRAAHRRSRTSSSGARCAASSPPAASSWGSTWAPSTS